MAKLNPEEIVRLYNEAKNLRNPHENDWRKAAAYCLPSHYASWQTEGPLMSPNNGANRTTIFDSTGLRSLPKYVAILERLATPPGQRWHALRPSDPTLRTKPRVRRYFDELSHLLFSKRYDPKARFRIATNEMYMNMGVYGNGPLFIGERKRGVLNPVAGIKYVACPLRDVFILVDDDGEVVIVFRRFWLNVRQFRAKFGSDTQMPKEMAAEAAKPSPSESSYFEIIHYVAVKDEAEYDPQALDFRRMPVCAHYLCVKSKEFIGKESGYTSIPYKVPRTSTVAGDAYGYSPAVQALASLGGANAIKKVNLKQGNKAVDPVLLAADDNAMNGTVDLRPGAVNYGGIDRSGRPTIQPLKTGDFRVAEALLADERADVEDSFFVTLFQILTDTPEMTATEVVERVAEKAALLSPTMGRLQSEFLGPSIEREIDVFSEMGILPEMPPELVEAQGEYEVQYTSPMAKAMYMEEVSGFTRSVEMTLNVVNATQDPSHLDHYDFDVALPEIADHLAVPTRWMADVKKVQAKREGRQAQQEQQQVVENAPALASVATAAMKEGQA